MSIKVNAGNKLLAPADFLTNPSVADTSYDFYYKNNLRFGYIYQNLQADATMAASKVWAIGPVSVLSLQAIGTGTIAVQGSLDGTTFVTATSTTTSDGLVRVYGITAPYRFFKFALTSTAAGASLFLMTS